MPRRKELHYFTRSLRYPSANYLAEPDPVARLLGRRTHHKRFRRELFEAFGRNLRHPSLTQFRWDMRYFFGTYDDEWYLSLFPSRGRVTGEVTPAYALLDDTDVASLVNLLPDVKVFYLLRDPVSRAWSTVRYRERMQGSMDYSEAYLTTFLSQTRVVDRSQYADVIKRWSRHLPPDQFLVAYYDQILHSPRELLSRVLEFLEVSEPMDVLRQISTGKINASPERQMPPTIERFLSRQYLPMLEELAGLVDSDYVKSWLARARSQAGQDEVES